MIKIIFAINKIYKPGANPDNVRKQLSELNILVEEWGGKYQSQEISAKQGTNIDLLLEKILLEAELLELKAKLKDIIDESMDDLRIYPLPDDGKVSVMGKGERIPDGVMVYL